METQNKTSKIALWSWAFFDFANSAFPTLITTFIFATYFIQSIASNPIKGTEQWSNATTIAGLIIALLSPIFGAIADFYGQRKRWLGFFSILVMISCYLFWFAKPEVDYVPLTLTLFVIATIGFELGTVFYNAMLADIAPKNYVGRVSGWAWGLGYFGGLLCLLLALLLFVQTEHPLLHLDRNRAEQIRIIGPLVAIWFLVFSIPLYLFTPDRPKSGLSLKRSVVLGVKSLSNTLKKLNKYPNIFKFLLAHMIYIDGLNTIFAFGGIYAAGTFGMQTQQIILFGLATNIAAGLGAVSFAWVDDFIGSKETIIISLIGMTVFGLLLLMVHSQFWFWIFALMLCLFVGPTQAASRTLLIRVSPPEIITEIFGLYAFSGKITSFLSPWLLGLVTLYANSQRAGMLIPILFIFAGGVVLLSVNIKTHSAKT